MKIGELAREGCGGSEFVRSVCVFKEILRHHIDVELLVDLDYDRKRGAVLSDVLLWGTFRDRKPATHENFRS
jgi:hypothetical protein